MDSFSSKYTQFLPKIKLILPWKASRFQFHNHIWLGARAKKSDGLHSGKYINCCFYKRWNFITESLPHRSKNVKINAFCISHKHWVCEWELLLVQLVPSTNVHFKYSDSPSSPAEPPPVHPPWSAWEACYSG